MSQPRSYTTGQARDIIDGLGVGNGGNWRHSGGSLSGGPVFIGGVHGNGPGESGTAGKRLFWKPFNFTPNNNYVWVDTWSAPAPVLNPWVNDRISMPGNSFVSNYPTYENSGSNIWYPTRSYNKQKRSFRWTQERGLSSTQYLSTEVRVEEFNNKYYATVSASAYSPAMFDPDIEFSVRVSLRGSESDLLFSQLLLLSKAQPGNVKIRNANPPFFRSKSNHPLRFIGVMDLSLPTGVAEEVSIVISLTQFMDKENSNYYVRPTNIDFVIGFPLK